MASFICWSQEYGDKAFYLVDSLNLTELTDDDKTLIDSCLTVYHNAKNDTSQINAIANICEGMMHNDWNKYQFFLHPIIEKALNRGITDNTSQKTIDRLRQSLANSLNNIGYIYNHEGNIPEAAKYYHKSLKLEEELNDKYGMAVSYNNLGLFHYNQDDYKTALDFYLKSIPIYHEINRQRELSIVYSNIGLIHQKQNNDSLALKHFLQALKIKEEIGEKRGLGITYHNLGFAYKKLGNISLAVEYSQKGLVIDKEIKNKPGITTAYNFIASLALNRGEINGENGALALATKSLEIAQEIGYVMEIREAASLLSKTYEQLGDYKKSLEMFELKTQMQDSLKNEEAVKATIQQQTKYEYEKQKVLDDAEHEKQLLLQHKEKEKQQLITYATAGGLILVLAFLAFVFNRLKATRKQKEAIDAQKQEIEQTHQQLEIHHKEITDSINYAERIQRSFLATTELLNYNLNDHFVFFKPKDVVSGDFYWAGTLQNGDFAIVNADSTGHGVPGAIMSILNTSSIEKAVDQGLTNPADIFNSTRKTIIERLKKDGSENGGKDGMDASIICFNAAKTKMTYCAAQNPIWIIRQRHCEERSNPNDEIASSAKLLRNDEYELIEIKPEKMPVGKHDNDHIPFVGGEFEIQKGDQIYTLTDGYQDQFGGPKGKKFMIKKLRELVISNAQLPMLEQHLKLEKAFNSWKGSQEQVDDVCVIGVSV